MTSRIQLSRIRRRSLTVYLPWKDASGWVVRRAAGCFGAIPASGISHNHCGHQLKELADRLS